MTPLPSTPDGTGAPGASGAEPVGHGATRNRREVPTLGKLAGFALMLAAVFGATLVLGGQVGSSGEPGSAEHSSDDPVASHGDSHGGSAAEDTTNGEATVQPPGGLQVSEAGYTLVLSRSVVPAGNRTVEFRIDGPGGGAVTDYEIEHEKELHLIAVRRDLTGFQHVHPERGSDGTWRIRLDLTGGTWRLFADFTPAPEGTEQPQPLTLGTDLTVTGPSGRLAEAGPATSRIDTVDGYRVEMTGTLAAGEESELRFSVTRQGRPVADLQPYLGARGHLVALREGDLAYLHVHPTDDEDAVGNEVGFAATAPSVGGYRLYLDFRVGGAVHTASFALPATGSDGAAAAGDGDDARDSGGGHGEDDHIH